MMKEYTLKIYLTNGSRIEVYFDGIHALTGMIIDVIQREAVSNITIEVLRD
jgi:hypothetical protein